jgi:hypothetical protein
MGELVDFGKWHDVKEEMGQPAPVVVDEELSRIAGLNLEIWKAGDKSVDGEATPDDVKEAVRAYLDASAHLTEAQKREVEKRTTKRYYEEKETKKD